MDIFWGSSQNWTIFSGHFYAFQDLFLRPRYGIRDIFLGCQKFKYFFGMLEMPDIFGGLTVDAGPEPTYEEKNEYRPPRACLPGVQARSDTRQALLVRHPTIGSPEFMQGFDQLGSLRLCLAPKTELDLKTQTLKTLTLETLTCPLGSKHGQSQGRPHFVGIRQVGLRTLSSVYRFLAYNLCKQF